uniref:RRM domain-containing protein n=1 Tax=Sinocyclocheilus rhinocerous TaxID=307959 RepID=A0A673L577_9TELE
MRVIWADHLLFPGHSEIPDLCEDISFFGQFQTCRVHVNNSFDPKESSSHAPRSLLVSNLMTCVSKEELLEVFIPFGPISTVHVCRNELTKVSRGFGFITFKQRRDAESALEALNFSELFGKKVFGANPYKLWGHLRF